MHRMSPRLRARAGCASAPTCRGPVRQVSGAAVRGVARSQVRSASRTGCPSSSGGVSPTTTRSPPLSPAVTCT
jgi:hypothetical protein